MLLSDDNFYMPSYFYIKLDNTANIGKLFNTQYEGTFAHEYIHLLQDISLTAPRAMMRENVNQFRALSDEIKKGMTNRPIQCVSNNLVTNKEIASILWGNGESYKSVEIIDVIKTCKKSKTSSIEIDLLSLCIKTEEGEVNYDLGIRDFCENMAFCIESEIYGVEDLPDAPYSIVKKILDFQGYTIDNFSVSLICELSLMSFNPISAFIRLLENFPSELTKESVFDTMYQGIMVADSYGNNMSLDVANNQIFQESKTMILDWFKSPIYSDIGAWIEKILSIGQQERLKNVAFISEIIDQGNISARKALISLIQATGVPAIYNANYEIYIIDPMLKIKDTFPLIALNELFSYLSSTRINCSLVGFCEKSGINNDSCHFNLLDRLKLTKLCPIAGWIKTFGFQKAIN